MEIFNNSILNKRTAKRQKYHIKISIYNLNGDNIFLNL